MGPGTARFDVIGLGCSCVDMLAVVPTFPQPGQEITAVETAQQGGGEVATALVTLARLGSSTCYLGQVGADSFGRLMQQEFQHYGVDTSHMVLQEKTLSQLSMILVDQQTGTRTIVACPPTASELKPGDIPSGLIELARVLHLDGAHRAAALEAAQRARRAGVRVVLDADVTALDDSIHQLIRITNVVIASRPFARSFSASTDPATAIEALRSLGPAQVVITLGKNGSIGWHKGVTLQCPAFPIQVLDTTGAGDVFHGAFIHDMLQDWHFEKVLEFASAAAALKCTKMGGRAGIADFPTTVAFLKQQKDSHLNQSDGSVK